MSEALAFVTVAALTATASAFSGAAQAHDRWLEIPFEVGAGAPVRDGWIPYRCSEAPVYNFYHGAYYGEQPPAVFLGHAYRPYYRYTAYRVLPRTYICSEAQR